MKFRPALVPTLMSIPMVLVMLALGTWQLQRLAWKTEIIDTLSARLSEPAAPAPIGSVEGTGAEFLKVGITGEWLHDQEMLILSRPEKGTPGFHIVTPLEAQDGRVFIVNRGWVPDRNSDKRTRPDSLVAGPVEIEGMIRTMNRRGWFRPDNEPERDLWLYEDPIQMAAHHELENAEPYLVVEITSDNSPRLPVAASPEKVLSIRNEHLSYAVTWFGMAIALIVIYGMWHKQQGRLEL